MSLTQTDAPRITAIQVLPEQWVRGKYEMIAALRYPAAELEQRLNVSFMEDIEEGVGPFKAMGFQTPRGRRFCIRQYLKVPEKRAVVVTCLHDQHFCTDLDDVLESLDMDLSDVFVIDSKLVISDEVLLVPHTLWRGDDNGARVFIETFPCRASASKRMRAFEAAGHKQVYWIEPLDASQAGNNRAVQNVVQAGH